MIEYTADELDQQTNEAMREREGESKRVEEYGTIEAEIEALEAEIEKRRSTEGPDSEAIKALMAQLDSLKAKIP